MKTNTFQAAHHGQFLVKPLGNLFYIMICYPMSVAISNYLIVKKKSDVVSHCEMFLTAVKQEDLRPRRRSYHHYSEWKGSKEGYCWGYFCKTSLELLIQKKVLG